MANESGNPDRLTPEQQALHDKLEALARDRSPIDPNQSDEAKRAAFADLYERESVAAFEHANRRDAIAATGFECGGGDDPTTAAIEANNAEREQMWAQLDAAWGLIANASGGDWSKQSPEWVAAAERWRDGYSTPTMHDAPPAPPPRTIDVVFDGPPGHEAGRLVEVEDENGHSIKIGEWIDRRDGMWALRIPIGSATEIARLTSDREKLDRAAREEVARLRRQVDELTRQRDAAEERFQEANHLHGEASAALSAMTIKWLNLGNEAKALVLRLGDAPPVGYRAGAVAELRIANRRMGEIVAANNEEFVELRRQIFQLTQDAAKRRVRFEECEAACWEALQSIPRDVGLPFFTERGPMDVEDAVQEVIASAVEQVRDQQEQLRIADADRVPLRMDLDAVRAELARANACALRMEPVTKAAEKAAAIWNGSKVASIPSPLIAALCELSDADKAYGDACKQAQSDSADPDQIDMPF